MPHRVALQRTNQAGSGSGYARTCAGVGLESGQTEDAAAKQQQHASMHAQGGCAAQRARVDCHECLCNAETKNAINSKHKKWGRSRRPAPPSASHMPATPGALISRSLALARSLSLALSRALYVACYRSCASMHGMALRKPPQTSRLPQQTRIHSQCRRPGCSQQTHRAPADVASNDSSNTAPRSTAQQCTGMPNADSACRAARRTCHPCQPGPLLHHCCPNTPTHCRHQPAPDAHQRARQAMQCVRVWCMQTRKARGASPKHEVHAVRACLDERQSSALHERAGAAWSAHCCRSRASMHTRGEVLPCCLFSSRPTLPMPPRPDTGPAQRADAWAARRCGRQRARRAGVLGGCQCSMPRCTKGTPLPSRVRTQAQAAAVLRRCNAHVCAINTPHRLCARDIRGHQSNRKHARCQHHAAGCSGVSAIRARRRHRKQCCTHHTWLCVCVHVTTAVGCGCGCCRHAQA
jgi:hypothetical protein